MSLENHKIVIESGEAPNASTQIFDDAVVLTKFNAQPRLTKLYGLREACGNLVFYFTTEEKRGKGLASKALTEVISKSHVDVFASIFEDNIASIKTAKRSGMTQIAKSSFDGKSIVLFKG